MLGDADEAEDAVQHTFMAAYRELSRSDKPIHLRAWLYTVARNRCYSIIRARREQPSDSLDEAATEGLAAEVQRRQDLRDLVADLRRLPDEQRAALVLAELDALSHEDIAGVLGVPRDKVKALVFQARESLVASRTARDTACAEIREQLASGRGASLRRSNLRRHLRDCDGCREFRAQVETQHRKFSVLLPVLPAAALKQGLFGGTGVLIGGTAAVGGGAVAATALKTGVVKGVLGTVIASLGTAGTLVVTGSDMELKSLMNGVEHAVPKWVPTSRAQAHPARPQPQPLARPQWVHTSRPAVVVPSFAPTRAPRSVAVTRLPRPAAPAHPRFVAARLAAPVYVRHVSAPAPAPTPVARPVRVPVAPAPRPIPPREIQPAATPVQVPSAVSTTTHAAPAPASAPVTPPPVTPAPVTPPASTPPVATPAAGASQPASASVPAKASQAPAAPPQPPARTSATSVPPVTGYGNGNGNGNAYGWRHDRRGSWSTPTPATPPASAPGYNPSTSTSAPQNPASATSATTPMTPTSAAQNPASANTATAPMTPNATGSADQTGADGAGGGDQGGGQGGQGDQGGGQGGQGDQGGGQGGQGDQGGGQGAGGPNSP